MAIIGSFVLLSTFIISCSSSEKAAVPCPKFSGYRYNQGKHDHRHSAFRADVNKRIRGQKDQASRQGNEPEYISIPGNEMHARQEHLDYLNYLTASIDNRLYSDVKMPSPALVDPDTENPVLCDTIVLKPGNVITGKVVEITPYEVRYKHCSNLEGPVLVINKADVFVIKYPNGTRDYFTPVYTAPAATNNAVKKTEGLGTAGFITSLVGLFILGIPLGILSIVFGAISLGKIKRHPEKYKGKGFAITAVLVGFVDIVGMLILLALM